MCKVNDSLLDMEYGHKNVDVIRHAEIHQDFDILLARDGLHPNYTGVAVAEILNIASGMNLRRCHQGHTLTKRPCEERTQYSGVNFKAPRKPKVKKTSRGQVARDRNKTRTKRKRRQGTAYGASRELAHGSQQAGEAVFRSGRRAPVVVPEAGVVPGRACQFRLRSPVPGSRTRPSKRLLPGCSFPRQVRERGLPVLWTWGETGPGPRELRQVVGCDVSLNGAAHDSTSVCRRPVYSVTTNRATITLTCPDQRVMPGGR
ncbi:hypothetical protein HPB50_007438 [Hyalomma asiaticum]|uniref:Uncharacterized protein n=1 Tax=Hyalomma asiaticum TaxID=266040 RepID=A0ACB7RT51_HYAAI|nr:hypothetical protein HPB50_007438 [Hyalomma asiaticum]